MRVAPGPLDPAGVSAAEYDPLPREELPDARRLCPWVPSPLEIADHVVRLAGISEGDTVLDLGCGTGEVVMRICAQTGCSCLGVDISPSLVSTARLRASKRGMDVDGGGGCEPNKRCIGIADFQVADFCSPGFSLPAEVTVLYLYLLPRVLATLRPLLQEAVARRRVRVVSNQYHPDFLGSPARTLEGPDGRWQLRLYERPRSA